MEKFTFTLEQIKYLYDTCKKGEHIFVNGKNGIGENFFTCAKIYADEKGEPVINTDFIFLRFGEEVGGDLIYAPFHLNVEERTNVDDQLVIESITDKEGNIIYFNKEFSKSNKIFVENGTRIRANNKQITIKQQTNNNGIRIKEIKNIRIPPLYPPRGTRTNCFCFGSDQKGVRRYGRNGKVRRPEMRKVRRQRVAGLDR